MRVWPGIMLAFIGLGSAAQTGCVAMGLRAADYAPAIDPANFQTTVDNPYYPLVPGTTYRFVEKSLGETTDDAVTVTHETKLILGVSCVVVHDIATKNGAVAEDTYDWIAQDKQGTVWYFGEATREISPGGAVSTRGSWEAGVDGAKPGILMLSQPKPGPPYRQEYLLGVAEDTGQVEALGETVTVPAGIFTESLRTREWSDLEPGSEKKWYAKGVGFVRAESTGGDVEVLVSITRE